ncbi:MAG: VCBS repeat-containing protein [Algicola sp.]|nr:VCBS repeat-containing protein [Algicola sp.]
MSFIAKLSTNLVVLSLLCSAPSFARGPAKLNFTKQTINAELPVTGELTYFTLDNNKTHLLIQSGQSFTHIADVGSAKKSTQNNTKAAPQAKIIKMPDNTLFYNKGKLANVADDVLFYFTADEVLVYNLKTATIVKRLPVDSFYKGQQSIGAKRKDFIIDSNGDGLSDVITSNFDNINLYVQTADGEFEHQKLELGPQGQITSSGVNFSEHPATSMDVNNDGLADLAFQIDNELRVFAQNKQQRFATTATTITLNAGILGMKQKRQMKDKGEKADVNIRFEALKDLNGDGLMDLITQIHKRDGLMSSSSKYPVRFGRLNNGLLSFSPKSDTEMQIKGQGDIEFDDINNDGLQDYYTMSLEMGVGAMMSLMSGSIDMDLQFYPMGKNHTFSTKPAYEDELEVQIDMDDNNGGEGKPFLAVEDFNGDGIKDLVKQTDDDEFRIFNGGDGRLFSRRGSKYDIDLPAKGSVEIKDINNDGKADLLFRFSKDKGRNKLTVWLSRS